MTNSDLYSILKALIVDTENTNTDVSLNPSYSFEDKQDIIQNNIRVTAQLVNRLVTWGVAE